MIPPSTQIPMASISVPLPTALLILPIDAAVKMAATAENKPVSTNTINLVPCTLIPEYLAASRFAPIAYILRPNVVLCCTIPNTTAHTTKMMNIYGTTPPSLPQYRFENHCTLFRPPVDWSPKIISHSPRYTTCVPNVMIIGFNSVNCVAIAPLMHPQTVPVSRATSTATPIGAPALYVTPSIVALNARMDPTEISISPSTSTKHIGNTMNAMLRKELVARNNPVTLQYLSEIAIFMMFTATTSRTSMDSQRRSRCFHEKGCSAIISLPDFPAMTKSPFSLMLPCQQNAVQVRSG